MIGKPLELLDVLDLENQSGELLSREVLIDPVSDADPPEVDGLILLAHVHRDSDTVAGQLDARTLQGSTVEI